MSEADARWFNVLYARGVAALESGDPSSAEAAARALQARFPGEVNSLRLLGLALEAGGRDAEGVATLEAVIAVAGDFAHARVDLAAAYRRQGRLAAAFDQLKWALRADPEMHPAWLVAGDLAVLLGDLAAARAAYQRFIATDPERVAIEAAGEALRVGDKALAEAGFRDILRRDQNHVGALCGLAAISLGAGYPNDAERLLRHALKRSRHLPLIHRGLAQTLSELGRFPEAEVAIRHSLHVDPGISASWVMLGTLLAHTLRQTQALQAYGEALRLDPGQVRVELSRGHVLKTLGRRAEAEAAYRGCLLSRPDFGEAYYSLADLKNYVFSDAELEAMLRISTTAHTEFALGRAFEQRGEHARAFDHYARGNATRRREAPFDIGAFEAKCERVKRSFDESWARALGAGVEGAAKSGGPARSVDVAPAVDAAPFEGVAGSGDVAPIFIVGLPRSGSTLIEQVLASHSQVDGTMELPNILTYVREFERMGGGEDGYPEAVLEVPAHELRALGNRYLAETRMLRTGRRRFIDKMPNNFSHVGLIRGMLPNAIIIDARRHPMDAGWSAFKQYFAQGQAFTYDLECLGRYYRAYLSLMDHWNRVLPGYVMCMVYERVVADTESQVRRLLKHCGLEFEPACLKFHENTRAVRTASSEQVRMPIYSSSVGQWRKVDAQLEPLRRALGAALERFDI